MELEQRLSITNKYGLHARTSTRLAQVAQQFSSKIVVSRESTNGDGVVVRSEEVDAKSVLGLLSLGAECGDFIRIRISGDDAEAALTALVELAEQKFDEE